MFMRSVPEEMLINGNMVKFEKFFVIVNVKKSRNHVTRDFICL